MLRKYHILIALLVVVVVCALFWIFFLRGGPEPVQYQFTKAARRDIKVTVNTNGIVDPVNRSEIYAPVDGRVVRLLRQEGSEIKQGQLLMQLESESIRTALAEAKTSLLSAKREARVVMTGPPKEEIAELDAAIAEYQMQANQNRRDIQVEESLAAKGATPRSAVEDLQKQRDLLRVRLQETRKKKDQLLQRYSAEDKEWEQARIDELAKQAASLEKQLQMESVLAPASGLIYSLQVRAGAFVTRGQLLAQIYQPGKIMLRAYVDEPDLGRVKKGQPVLVQWDGLPDRKWHGVVEKPAEQVVALNNRSVGNVLCSVEGDPRELIPNLNIKVEITTDLKTNAIVLPRSAVFGREGKSVVLVSEGERAVAKPVEIGLVTPEEIEILGGIDAGDSIALNPGENGK
jgi:HlyD family secretion protein